MINRKLVYVNNSLTHTHPSPPLSILPLQELGHVVGHVNPHLVCQCCHANGKSEILSVLVQILWTCPQKERESLKLIKSHKHTNISDHKVFGFINCALIRGELEL